MSLFAFRFHHLDIWTEDTRHLACWSLPFADDFNVHLQLQATTSKKQNLSKNSIKKGKRKTTHQINPKTKCQLGRKKKEVKNIFLGVYSSSTSNILNLSHHGHKLSEAAISKLWERPFASVSWTSAHKHIQTHEAWGPYGHFAFPFTLMKPWSQERSLIKYSFSFRCE